MTQYCFKQMLADVIAKGGLANTTQQLNMTVPVYLNFIWSFCHNLTARLIEDEVARAKHNALYLIDIENLYTPHYDMPILGIASPIVILLTVILNILTMIVLCKTSMRSPTNVILLAMAAADMFTGLSQLPWYLFAFHEDRFTEYPPFGWCVMYYYVSIVAGTCFHTASIMLNVMLAIHRYIGICHHRRAKTWCGYRPVFIGITLITILSILPHVVKYLDLMIIETDAISKTDLHLTPADSDSVSTCMFTHRAGFQTIYHIQIYFWMRAILIQLLPCFILVIVNGLLIRTVVRSYWYRIRLTSGNRSASIKDLHETRRVTVMLVVIITFFLATEIPVGIAYTLYVIRIITKMSHVVTKETISILTTVTNFLIFVSSPVNFFVYIVMNSRFRLALTAMFCCRKQRADGEHPGIVMLPWRLNTTNLTSINTHSHRSGSRSNISVCTTYSSRCDVRRGSNSRHPLHGDAHKNITSAFLRGVAMIALRLSRGRSRERSYDVGRGQGQDEEPPVRCTSVSGEGHGTPIIAETNLT
ncbi:sex peptide receptor-like [Lineus longissimus]|uniref:sex peptide receptor-like n=1 Tax=Lineus longissimus TaxID=88925 RepID=UPI00315D5D5A